MSTKYNPSAQTAEDHFANCEFQALNVKGWLSVGKPELALIKAECLRDDLNKLIATLEAQVAKEAAR